MRGNELFINRLNRFQLLPSVEKEVMVADEEAGHSHAALAALKTEREDLTARITEMQQGLHVHNRLPMVMGGQVVPMFRYYFLAVSSRSLTSLWIKAIHSLLPTESGAKISPIATREFLGEGQWSTIGGFSSMSTHN